MANDQLLERSEDAPSTKGGKHRRTPSQFFRDNWVELSAVALLAAGIFLLLERLQIKLAVYNFLVICIRAVRSAAVSLWDAIVHATLNVEQSDIVGVVLVITGTSIIVYRSRLRAIARHPEIDLLEECPQCGEALGLLKRNWGVRLTETLLWIRVRRYACTNCSFHHAVWHSRRS